MAWGARHEPPVVTAHEGASSADQVARLGPQLAIRVPSLINTMAPEDRGSDLAQRCPGEHAVERLQRAHVRCRNAVGTLCGIVRACAGRRSEQRMQRLCRVPLDVRVGTRRNDISKRNAVADTQRKRKTQRSPDEVEC